MAENEKIEIEIVLDDGKIIKGLAKVKKAAKKAADDTESSFTNAFSALKGPLLSFAASFSALSVIKSATKDFIQFERALAGVAKTTNITGKELDALGKDFQRLSTEIPVTANELLRLAQVGGQFGVRGRADILKFTETVAKLQFTIEGIDPETAAQNLTRMLNVTRQGVKNIDRLSSSLVALGNNFEATEGDILSTGSEVIRATAQFGVTAQEGLALGAALQSVGAKAEGSGSAVGQAFAQIAKAIGKPGKTLREFSKIIGVSGDELKKMFDKDAIGVFQKLIEGLGKVKGGSVGLTLALKELGLDNKRVIKSLVPLVLANDKLTESLRLSRTEFIKNQALNAEFSRVNATTEASIKRLQGRITKLSTNIGTILAPALRSGILLLSDLVKAADRFTSLAFGTGLTKALEQNALAIERNQDSISRFRLQADEIREKLALNPDSKFLQNVAIQNKEFADAARERFVILQAEREKLLGIIKEPIETPVDDKDKEDESTPSVADTSGAIKNVGEGFQNFTDGFKQNAREIALASKSAFGEVGKQAVLGLGKTAGGAFAALGKALAKGENGFKAFAGAILAGFAQVAIQLGTQFLLTGLAYKFSGIPTLEKKAAPLIAAGAALATFGGALSALGGGGGGEGGGGDAATPVTGFADDEEIGEDLVEEKITKVAINVEGTVLDPQTVGNQIAQILNDTFEAGGTRVVTA